MGTRIKASKIETVIFVDKDGNHKKREDKIVKHFAPEMWDRIKVLDKEWKFIEKIDFEKARKLVVKKTVPQNSSERELLVKQAKEMDVKYPKNISDQALAIKVNEAIISLSEKVKEKTPPEEKPDTKE